MPSQSTPFQCGRCGASLALPRDASITDVGCDYCGTQTPVPDDHRRSVRKGTQADPSFRPNGWLAPLPQLREDPPAEDGLPAGLPLFFAQAAQTSGASVPKPWFRVFFVVAGVASLLAGLVGLCLVLAGSTRNRQRDGLTASVTGIGVGILFVLIGMFGNPRTRHLR